MLPLSCTPHIAFSMDLSVLRKLPISLSGTMLHFHTVLLSLHSFYKQPLSAFKEILPYINPALSLILTHPLLVLALTPASHPPPPLLPLCLSNIPFTFCACCISLKLWSYPFHSGTSIVDPFTTLYTQY